MSSEATATASAPTPAAPRGLSDEARSAIEARAADLTTKVSAHPDDRALARSLSQLGSDAQQQAGAKLDLLKTKVGTLLKELDGEGEKIPQGLLQLRKTMDSINPHLLATKPRGFISKLLRRTPVVGDVLADIAVRYESVQTQIDAIIDGLRVGKDELLADSLELERLYEQVQAAQMEIQQAAFLSELVWGQLEDKLAKETNPDEQQRLRTILHRVAMRAQDLRTMEQVNTQFFISIDMTVQNNDHLSDAITRTLTVTRSLLTVGLAIQAALANQKKIMKAVQETQAYASDMLAANAAALRQQTAEIGDLYENPVLALDKVKAAYDDLMGAMDELDAIKQRGTENARKGMSQLAEMTDKLAPRAEALRSAREFEADVDGAGA